MEWFIRLWIPLAIAVTGICLLVFSTVQHAYRQTLNDPQVQMAEDAALELAGGGRPQQIIATSTKRVNIAESLRPYLVIYSEDMVPLAWTGELGGQPPQPPREIFEAARGPEGTGPGQYRETWEAADGVRSAVVVIEVLGDGGGYVLAGRNIREVDDRIWDMQVLVGVSWLMILAATLIATWLGARAAAGKTGVVW